MYTFFYCESMWCILLCKLYLLKYGGAHEYMNGTVIFGLFNYMHDIATCL